MVALVAVGSVTAWYTRVTLLQAAASWWIVSDEVEPSDVVAVFGGGLELRPFVAADYYKRGLVKRIALSNIGHSPVEDLGIEPSHVAANRAVMIKLGVPESAIETFGDNLKNTHEEAIALHRWAVANGVRSIIMPTEIFTSRRLAWMLHQVFGGDAVIRVVAVDPLNYNRKDWWRREAGLIGFQNEFIKYLYYRAEY